MSGEPLRAWVICRRFGAVSEPWIWRQVVSFRRLRPEVVTAAHENPATFPLDGVPLHLVPAMDQMHHGMRRWLTRATGVPQRNLSALGPLSRRELVSLARRREPSVALCHFGHVALHVLPAIARAGVPLVVHFHGLDLSSSLRNRWYRWSLLQCLRKFAGAVVVGTHQRDTLEDLGMPSERIHLVPCGVPVVEYRVRRHTDVRVVRFAAVSRLVAWKGVDVTLRAFAAARRSNTDLALDVVGDGPEGPDLRRLADELGIGAAVTFHGSLAPAAVADLLASSDVFLQHSLTYENGWVEGFGVSITEAAASGLPVVVTPCGGIVDQVGDGVTGFVVPERDVESMASRMLELADDPALRQRMGDASRRLAEERFDVTRQVQRLESVLLGAAR